jgi:CBS domain-containing protein
MALPPMESDTRAIGRVPGAHQITTTTSVCEARAHLHTTGETAAVVYRNGRPVGVVSSGALVSASMARGEDASISSVMDYVAVPVDRRTDAIEIIRTFDSAAWDWLKRRPGETHR